MGRVSQQNIYETAIWTRKKKKGYIPIATYGKVGEQINNFTKDKEYEIYNIFIEAAGEYVDNTIWLTLNADQNQEDENANYELLNYIYDNFESHTDFFNRIRLRFLEKVDFEINLNISINKEVCLRLKKYVYEDDAWIEDEGADILEYFLCFDIRDFGIDECVPAYNMGYNRTLPTGRNSDEIAFDNSIFCYLSKNKEFVLDLYFRNIIYGNGGIIGGADRRRGYVSSSIINSNKLVLYGERVDGLDIDGEPIGLIELEYGFPLLLNYIRQEAQLNIGFDIKLTDIRGEIEDTRLKIEYRSDSHLDKAEAMPLTGIISGKFNEVLFEDDGLLKCQFSKDAPNMLLVYSNYDITAIIDRIDNEIAGVNSNITAIEGNISNIHNIITDIGNEITNIHNIIGNIGGGGGGCDCDLSGIEDSISTINGNIGAINGNITTINADLDMLKDAVDPLAKNGVWIQQGGGGNYTTGTTAFNPNIMSTREEVNIPWNYILVLEWRAMFSRVMGDVHLPTKEVVLECSYHNSSNDGRYCINQGYEPPTESAWTASWTEYKGGGIGNILPQIWYFIHQGRNFTSAICHWKIIKIQ